MEPKPEVCKYCGISTPWYCVCDEDANVCSIRKQDFLKRKKAAMAKNDELNDFGFSIATEEQIAAEHVTATKDQCKRDLVELRDMIAPLLKNLAKPGGTTIYWPDREKKVSEFITKINTFVEDALKR